MRITASIAAAAMSAALFIVGCTPDESTIIAAANTAGNLGISAWFAIDNPDDQVKAVIKDVVTITEGASSKIGAGRSYVDALSPVVHEIIAKHDELTPAQKNLINTGSTVVLSALDTFIGSNEKVKENAELASKVIDSFCIGCLTAIERSSDSAISHSLINANKIINMQYDVKAKAFVNK